MVRVQRRSTQAALSRADGLAPNGREPAPVGGERRARIPGLTRTASWAYVALILPWLAACGPTIGDPCTTTAECGGQLCINEDFAPGGYCSKPCDLGDERSCPVGTICVREALANNGHACFRTCTSQADCRPGYLCTTAGDSARAVCIGPSGL